MKNIITIDMIEDAFIRSRFENYINDRLIDSEIDLMKVTKQKNGLVYTAKFTDGHIAHVYTDGSISSGISKEALDKSYEEYLKRVDDMKDLIPHGLRTQKKKLTETDLYAIMLIIVVFAVGYYIFY